MTSLLVHLTGDKVFIINLSSPPLMTRVFSACAYRLDKLSRRWKAGDDEAACLLSSRPEKCSKGVGYIVKCIEDFDKAAHLRDGRNARTGSCQHLQTVSIVCLQKPHPKDQ